MSNLYCSKCKEFMLYPDSHTCSPEWELWRPEEGETRDDCRTVYGISAERAAEKWAQRSDSDGDYTIVGGTPAMVCLAMAGDDDVHYIRVEGCSVPEYTASKIDDDQVKLLVDWNQNHPKGTRVKVKIRRRAPPSFDVVEEVVIETETTSDAWFDNDGYAIVRIKEKPYEANLDDVEPM